MTAVSKLDQPTREQVLALYHGGRTYRELCDLLGLTDEEAGAALLEARFNKVDRLNREVLTRGLQAAIEDMNPLPSDMVWCGQCERRVKPGEIVACQSRWCKAKVAA